MARQLIASEILKIAGEIRAMVAEGAQVLNLTVGDFAPAEFPIPGALGTGIKDALDQGHTNYPPSSGMLECREAVRELFRDRLGLDYPVSSVLIASGARPMIAGIYLALIDPGDEVVYGVPSWNNNHYCTLTGARAMEITATRETGFFPRVSDFEPHLPTARLLCLNTPQNPTGTMMQAKELDDLSRAIVTENRRRERAGQPALYVMFDQVYWMLTAKGRRHENPVSLVPEIAPYTIFVDGISKCFAATGVRVGWAVGPTDVIERMAAILTHIGAWAPRAEQVAVAKLLRDRPTVDAYLENMKAEVFTRLERLAAGIAALKKEGHPVDAVAPAGAIYLSIKVDVAGRTTPDGKRLETDEDIRGFLLKHAGMAVVPFQAFGVREDSGWFRASVGAVKLAELEQGTARLRSALAALR
ncbi:MAG: aminotransferase class I/II-fold pyridoxal phosphate-dependent enzyme [Deltaproteobacteria bacterium]|nr:aminotransferase class I/II-fold pyridoxal phosphate-dependent enzyme [Deltaproteobacteria bacterium]